MYLTLRWSPIQVPNIVSSAKKAFHLQCFIVAYLMRPLIIQILSLNHIDDNRPRSERCFTKLSFVTRKVYPQNHITAYETYASCIISIHKKIWRDSSNLLYISLMKISCSFGIISIGLIFTFLYFLFQIDSLKPRKR